MSDLDLLRRKLASSCRALAKEGFGDGTSGHVSARIDSETFLMKPSGLGLEEISADDLVILNLEGQKLEGHRKPHNEIPIHSEIYRARPEVGCVIHTHPAFSTVFGATGQELRPISHHGCRFWPGVPHYPTGELITTKEQGVKLAATLGDRDAVFLHNHGIAVVGASVEDACLAAVYLEKACRLQLMLINYPNFSFSGDEEASSFRTFSSTPHRALSQWNYYLRKWGEENFKGNSNNFE